MGAWARFAYPQFGDFGIERCGLEAEDLGGAARTPHASARHVEHRLEVLAFHTI